MHNVRNLLSSIKAVAAGMVIPLLLLGLSSPGYSLTAREEAQSEALGTLIYNYERRANRGLVRSASNLSQRLPVDSHPQEVLDLVSAAAGGKGISDFSASLLAIAADAERLGFGASLSSLAALLDSDPGTDPGPDPDPLPEIDLDAIAAQLAAELEAEFLLENPFGLPPVIEIIGKDSVLDEDQVVGYEIYLLVSDLLTATQSVYTYALDLYGNVIEVIVST